MKSYILTVFTLAHVLGNVCRAINYRPYFTRPSLVKTIPENVGKGYFIADISGYTVDDENDFVTYGLDTYGSQLCNIGPRDGRLTLKRALDREVQAQFKIIVSAQDSHQGGGQHRTAYLPVFLYVLDVNDNHPVFLNTPYIAKIPENATVGTSIIQVQAFDADDGLNAEIEYSFKDKKESDKFSINGDTGLITLDGTLDYEADKKHTLVVIAKDKGTPKKLESQTTVVIDVTDVQDTNPRFLHSSYQTQIDENSPMGSSVIKVTAIDGDTEVNQPIEYSVVTGNEEGLFIIEKKNGIIRINGTIDRETNNIFKIKVKAYEERDPPAFATVDVIILVNDVNDNRPTFKKDHYTFTVKENAPIGFALNEQFSAVDTDIENKNKKLVYSLKDAEDKFAIDPTTGKLMIAGEIDFEKQRQYNFTILATETDTDERYSGSTNVTVNVINENDNTPMFERLVYIFIASEDISTEKVIGRVKATDADIGSYGKVSYEIKTNKIGSPLFSIDSKTGDIFVARPLDYSKAPSHHFVVIAKDDAGQLSRESRTLVQVAVVNVSKPTTRNLPETKTLHQKTTTKTMPNEISEMKRIVEKNEQRTRSSSVKVTSNFIVILSVVLTSLYSLRALVT
ncbi:cadherin-89D-like isoform X2 [Rhopilema esculentum]